MHKYVWTGLIVTTLSLVGLFWTVKSVVQYKPTLPRGVPRDITSEELEEIKRLAREEMEPTAQPESRVVVKETEHDFGTLDPNAAGTYVFEVRNTGFAPLMLGDPQPTCSCASATYSRRKVPPGEKADVEMTWSVGDKVGPFSVGVNVPTSDPKNNLLHLRVRGHVRVRLASAPDYFALGDLAPGQSSTVREALIYSELWSQFQLEDVRCSLPGATCDVSPATAEELQVHKAKSGYRIRLTVPGDLPSGPVGGKVEFFARAAESEDAVPYTMSIAGNVRGRLSIHGSAIDADGIIDLGSFARSEGKQLRLLVKVRDAVKELPQARFEIEPAFVTAQLVEQGVASGLYALDITVPKDAPATVHLRPDQWGTLTLLTDHPRIPSTKLRLRFAITERTVAKLD